MRIELDTRQLGAALKWLPDNLVRPAARMAINDAGRQGQTAARQAIYDQWNLDKAFINERVKISSFARNDDLSLEIRATGRPIDLSRFSARWVRGNRIVTRDGTRMLKRGKKDGGVFVKIRRGAEITHLPSAFMATVRAGKSSSHVGVFVRVGRARLPIIKKAMISVPSMFEQEQVYEAIRQVIEAKFPERFSHHLDRMAAGPSQTP